MNGKGVLLLSEIIFLVSLVLLINGSESRHAVRRRSHQHLSVCRKEFLRPLEKRIADVDLVFTGIVERIYQQVESSSDEPGSGGERRRRQHQVAAHHRRHHRHHPNARSHHHLRSHRQHDVRSFSQSGPNWIPGSGGSGGSGNTVSMHYRGIVRVKRVIKGDKRFQGNRVIVEGFGSDKFCVSDAKERDTRIFFANPILNGRLRIHSSLMHYNLENLRKVHLATKAAASEIQDDGEKEPSSPVSQTDATSTTTTTTRPTSAPVPQSSQSLLPDIEAGKKPVASVSMAENEIESGKDPDEGSKRKVRKKKKGKKRKNRRKHLHHVTTSSPFTTTTSEAAIESSSSTLSIIESSMLT